MDHEEFTRLWRRSAWALGLSAVAGCSMPLAVSRVVDRNAETRGVRFLVRRPSYEASLRLEESDDEECGFQLFLTQKLDGEPIEYEAIGEAHLLAATDVSLTEDQAGRLTAVSAGEIDKTHEAVQVAAGIAVSFRPIAAAAAEEVEECTPPSDDEGRLAEYVDAHRELASRLESARGALASRLASVGPKTGTGILRTIDSLRDLVDTLAKELAEHRYPLGSDQIHIYVGDIPAEPRAPTGVPWLKVILTPESAE